MLQIVLPPPSSGSSIACAFEAENVKAENMRVAPSRSEESRLAVFEAIGHKPYEFENSDMENYLQPSYIRWSNLSRVSGLRFSPSNSITRVMPSASVNRPTGVLSNPKRRGNTRAVSA